VLTAREQAWHPCNIVFLLVYFLMEIKARILPIEQKASDGSIFPRKVLIDYLESDTYKHRIATRTCLGSITHGNRDQKTNKFSLVPAVDQMLLNMMITHYVSKMYIEGDWLCGTIVLLPIEPFEGTQVGNWIKMVRGLVMTGIELPVSAVVVGEWQKDLCTKIYDIPGVDFTLDPGFKKAGLVLRTNKTYSKR